MEALWSPAAATGSNRWQMEDAENGSDKRKSFAVDGKEGVDGSSPSEGFSEVPAKRCFSLADQATFPSSGVHETSTASERLRLSESVNAVDEQTSGVRNDVHPTSPRRSLAHTCRGELPRVRLGISSARAEGFTRRSKIGSARPRAWRIAALSIVVRFNPTDLTTEKYEESVRRLEEAGVWPNPDGLEFHVLFGSEGNLRVSEMWDSRE